MDNIKDDLTSIKNILIRRQILFSRLELVRDYSKEIQSVKLDTIKYILNDKIIKKYLNNITNLL